MTDFEIYSIILNGIASLVMICINILLITELRRSPNQKVALYGLIAVIVWSIGTLFNVIASGTLLFSSNEYSLLGVELAAPAIWDGIQNTGAVIAATYLYFALHTLRVKMYNEYKHLSTFRHIASIIKHDMVSGLDYIEFGLQLFKNKMSIDTIKKHNLKESVQLIEGGYKQSAEILKGVEQWIDVIRVNEDITKESFDLTNALNEYMRRNDNYQYCNIDDLGTVTANKSLLLNAIENLIRNGIRHNDKDIKRIHIYRKGNTIYVEDNGNGFDISILKSIKEPQFSRKINGLGLSIVSEVCQLHNYELNATSIKGIGSTVSIKLS